MENLLPLLFSISAFVIFILMVLKMQSLKISAKTMQTLPPGPWRLPLIGNLHQIICTKTPHHHLRYLAKKYGPLMYLQAGEIPAVIVSSPEIAREILRSTHDAKFADRPNIPISRRYFDKDIVFGVYGDRWRMLKKICSEELLSPKRVQSFRSIREHEVSNFIGDLRSSSGSPVNLSSKIFSLTYLLTARAALNEKCKDQDVFLVTMNEVLRLGTVISACDLFPSRKWLHWIGDVRPKIDKLMETVDRIIESVVLNRKASPEAENCLLDVLLDIQKIEKLAFPLDTENIKAVIMNMFVAGSESSSVTIEWAMLEMLKNPRVMEKAQAEVRRVFRRQGNVDEASLHELEFLKMVVKETLRFHPSIPTIPREARDSCSINGYHIPAKTRVLIDAWAIGRDPRYWNDAERFYPERFVESAVDFKGTNLELIPFGAGRRICPGIGFAIAHIELVLAQLLFHFDWKLPNGTDHENLDMSESFGATVRRKQELCIIPVPYNPAAPT